MRVISSINLKFCVLLLNLIFSLASASSGFITPSKKSISTATPTKLIDDEFESMNAEQARIAATKYKNLTAGAMGTPVSKKLVDDEFAAMNKTQAKIAATRMKGEYESRKIASPISASRSPSRDFSSRGLSGNDLSGRFNSIAKESEEGKIETMTHEELIEFAKRLLANQESSSSTMTSSASLSSADTRHDTTTAISVSSTQDRELNRVFNGNRTMVEAYKAAVANRNLDGFWPVVKTEVIKNLTECINKIQPGGDDSVLLVQYASGIMYYAGSITKSVTKEEFLRNLALRVEALDFSKIILPADSESSLTKFKSEYVQEISKAVNSLVNEQVEGNDSAIILPQELEYNMQVMTRIVTNLRTKGVFKMALTVKGIEEKL
jgi:hypothetical protein